MADYYVKPAGGTPGTGTFLGVRANSTAYAVGDVLLESGATDHYVWEVTTAGTTGAAPPVFTKTPGTPITDGTAVITCRLPTSWALATANVQRADGALAAGDRLFLASTVNETYSATTQFLFAGTPGSPNLIISATLNSSPPTYAAGAQIKTNGSLNLELNGSVYMRGVTFQPGSAGVYNAEVYFGQATAASGAVQVLEDCVLDQANGSTADLTFGATNSSRSQVIVLNRCTIRHRNVSANLLVTADVSMYDCTLDPAGALLSVFAYMNPGQRECRLNAVSCDFSRLASSVNLVGAGDCTFDVRFEKCKFPASFTGLVNTNKYPRGRVSLYECEFGTVRQILWIDDYAGSIKDETTIVRSGGASDGVDAIAWKMETGSTANPFTRTLYTDWIAVPVFSTGSKTLTVEIVHDDTAGNELEDDEAWIEVSYFGTASSRLGEFTDDRLTDFLGTPADQDSSSATWSGTGGFGNVIKQKLVKTVTVNEEGIVYVRAALARPSKVMYLCPKVDVT